MVVNDRTPLLANAADASRPKYYPYWLLIVTGLCCGVTVISWTTSLSPKQESVVSQCDEAFQESGYIRLPNKVDDYYFYWFFESRDKPNVDPLVLWMTGGPGCSSTMALLTENGPCQIEKDMSIGRNRYSWTQKANIIWVDQPSGVGFSYGSSREHNEDEVAQNMYWFLQEWLRRHPKFQSHNFFIFAESYGGHYGPAVAHYVLKKNMQLHETGLFVNLVGIGVGNGLTSPLKQVRLDNCASHLPMS